jgi:AcrR family transcriptional regulator
MNGTDVSVNLAVVPGSDIPAGMAPGTQGFRLVDVLLDRAERMQHRPRRARTLAAIIASTAREMERSGIEGLTVARIASAAGLAHGTFYLYFENRTAAAMAVRRFFDAAMRRFRPRGGGRLPAFEAILRMNSFYAASYAANADLLRALQLLLYTQPEYARWRDRINHTWSRTILLDLARRLPRGGVEYPQATQILLIRSAIAMVDEMLREIYVHRGPSIALAVTDDEEVARFISLAWYRVLYGADPSGVDVPPARKLD